MASEPAAAAAAAGVPTAAAWLPAAGQRAGLPAALPATRLPAPGRGHGLPAPAARVHGARAGDDGDDDHDYHCKIFCHLAGRAARRQRAAPRLPAAGAGCWLPDGVSTTAPPLGGTPGLAVSGTHHENEGGRVLKAPWVGWPALASLL